MEGKGARHKRLLVLLMERSCLQADTGGHSGPPSLFWACNLCGDTVGGARGKQQLVPSGRGCPLENHLQNSGGPSRPGAEQLTPSPVLGPP